MTGRIENLDTLHEGWLALRMARVRMDDGSIAEREIVDHPSGAAVLLYNPERLTALLVSELRPPVEQEGEPRMLEVVAGVDEDGDAEACARREAEEEAGIRIRTLEPVARLWPTPATSTERVSLFLAAWTDADRIGKGGGLDEEQEQIRLREVPLADLWRLAEADRLPDAKTYLLLQTLRLRKPELFG